MTGAEVSLALGTVQFGTAYGIAGRGAPVPAVEVREILENAWQLGVRTIDTAPVYGDIEQRLVDLAGSHAFRIISKIPSIPTPLEPERIRRFVVQCISRSRQRLGDRLHTILFHRAADLQGTFGAQAWEIAWQEVSKFGIRLGVSCYSPEEADSIRQLYPIEVVQLPGNALDQRLASSSVRCGLGAVEVHLRSVFLQGLLLLPLECAVQRVPRAAIALKNWARWCTDHDIAPLNAALGAAKSIPGVKCCVIGVDRPSQLEELTTAWDESRSMDFTSLACTDLDVIDPRRWH